MGIPECVSGFMRITRRGNQTSLSISNPIKLSTEASTGKDEAALAHAQTDSCAMGRAVPRRDDAHQFT